MHTDKARNVESISNEDGFFVYVGQGHLKEWIKAKGISARFFTDEKLTEFGKSNKGLPDKASEEKERESILKIIWLSQLMGINIQAEAQ